MPAGSPLRAGSGRLGGLLRRTFLKLVGGAGLATVLPGALATGCGGGGGGSGTGPGTGPVVRYFTAAEREAFDALAAVLMPEGETVGAIGAGAVEYLDRWLAAFDHPAPAVYRGGPYSGRHPFPDPETGLPGDRYPRDSFRDVLPLTRLQELAFRIELYGSAAVPGGDVNDGVLPPTPGHRTLYREAAAEMERAAAERGAERFAALAEDERLAVFRERSREFRETFLGHLCEGLFGDPVYGGNRDGVAWRDYHYDGDSQPLGYTLHDPATGEPIDRPDKPNQGRDPALPNDGLTPDIERFIQLVAVFQGGRRFF